MLVFRAGETEPIFRFEASEQSGKMFLLPTRHQVVAKVGVFPATTK
jgi:hypothetical protein